MKAEEAPSDADSDGMPDLWEKAYGLDSNKADDALYTLDPQFTNLEVYLNSILTEH